MAKIEFAKSAIQRITDYICPRRVVFHHVPKCGGTSVGRSLRSAYLISQGTVTPEESFSAFAAYTGRRNLGKLSCVARLDDIKSFEIGRTRHDRKVAEAWAPECR